MSLYARCTKPAVFLVAMLALALVQGCQQQSGTGQTGTHDDKTKQVTVEITGMS